MKHHSAHYHYKFLKMLGVGILLAFVGAGVGTYFFFWHPERPVPRISEGTPTPTLRGTEDGPEEETRSPAAGVDLDRLFREAGARSAEDPLLERFPGKWHNIPQGSIKERCAEIPRDKQVVVVCNTGARSYEALVTLHDAGFQDVVSIQAKNGSMQARVDSLLEAQETRKIAIDTMLSGKTDANMAEAVTELEMAQIALQASAQVISQLRQVSLLD